SKQRHGSKRADERDNHSSQRDDRRAPTLEEKQHDQRYQENRLEERVSYSADRLLDEDCRVIDDLVIHTRWEILLYLLHRLPNRLCGIYRVATGELVNANRRRRAAVQRAGDGIALGPNFDSADIAQPHDLAARPALDHDGGELRGINQPALRINDILKFRSRRRRRLADDARRDLLVLFLNRLHYIRGRQAERGEPVGVQPYPHRIFVAEKARAPDTIDARNPIFNL